MTPLALIRIPVVISRRRPHDALVFPARHDLKRPGVARKIVDKRYYVQRQSMQHATNQGVPYGTCLSVAGDVTQVTSGRDS